MPSHHELIAIIIRTCTPHIPPPPFLLSYLAQLTSFKGLMVPAGYWAQLECHAGLIVSCFPAVNQIFRHWISEGDVSAQNNGVASWVLRRAIPGMNSIDTMSTDQGMDSRTVGRPEGLEGGVVEALPGGDGAVPVKCGGLWERDYS